MRLVAAAQASASRAQALADRAAAILFYVALGAGAITLVVLVAAQGDPEGALVRTATVLVIACPHALGLAIPLVIAISTSLGARNGLLVKDRLALERARDPRHGHLRQDRHAHAGRAGAGRRPRTRRRGPAPRRGGRGRLRASARPGHRRGARARGVRSAAATDFEALPGPRRPGAGRRPRCRGGRPAAPRGPLARPRAGGGRLGSRGSHRAPRRRRRARRRRHRHRGRGPPGVEGSRRTHCTSSASASR